ncbi:MAG: crotonase/enoyl-CoA hydratase family protein [Pseudomonadota bacterium]
MSALVSMTEEKDYLRIVMDDGKRNAVSFEMAEELNAAFDNAEKTDKTVVLAGRPGTFSAGFDLATMARQDESMVRLVREGADLAERILRFPQPVVLAVSGHALAMGAILCLSADYRIGAIGDFKIGLNEVAIGMTLPWFGVELARSRLAQESFHNAVALAKVYSPAQAAAVGFLDECVPEDGLTERAGEFAAQLAALGSKAHQQTKLRVREQLLTRYEQALERDFDEGQIMATMGA